MLLGPSACPPGILPSTSTDCGNAQASVDQMNATFISLNSPSPFAASVTAITQSLANAMPSFVMQGIPGNCNQAQTIGCEADALTNQMLVAAGQNPTPGPSSGGLNTMDLVLIGGVIVLAVMLWHK